MAGGFDEAAYQQLLAHPEMIDQLAQKILTDRFPASIQRIPPTNWDSIYRSLREPRSTLQGYRSSRVPLTVRVLRLRSQAGWRAGWS